MHFSKKLIIVTLYAFCIGKIVEGASIFRRNTRSSTNVGLKIAIMRALKQQAETTTRHDQVRIVGTFYRQLQRCIGARALILPGILHTTDRQTILNTLELVHGEMLFNLNQGRDITSIPEIEHDTELAEHINEAKEVILKALTTPSRIE